MTLSRFLIVTLIALGGCATTTAQEHGTMSELTGSASSADLCEHKVPKVTCTRCHPELVAQFKAAKDWCPEHDVAESQCLICHPDLTFEPLPVLPAKADVKKISTAGEDVPSLEAHTAPGKITVFDFYADWCVPCRKVDAHVFAMLQKRDDIALRKMNVVSWESPLAKRYLSKVQSLPYLIVFGKDGRQTKAVIGLDLPQLDSAIAEAGR